VPCPPPVAGTACIQLTRCTRASLQLPSTPAPFSGPHHLVRPLPFVTRPRRPFHIPTWLLCASRPPAHLLIGSAFCKYQVPSRIPFTFTHFTLRSPYFGGLLSRSLCPKSWTDLAGTLEAPSSSTWARPTLSTTGLLWRYMTPADKTQRYTGYLLWPLMDSACYRHDCKDRAKSSLLLKPCH
jgi:hypothetical protein